MKGKILFMAAILMVVFLGTAQALEFSADTIMSSSGRSVKGKMFMKDKKLRMESEGMPGYSIMRTDKNVIWMVMPSSQSYMEMKSDPANRPKTEEKVQGEITRKKIGEEKINGHPTEKFEVSYKHNGKTGKIYQWMATDIKFPVKTAATDGSFSQEYKNIKMGGQPDSLFEVPSGYRKMTMPAMPMPQAPTGR